MSYKLEKEGARNETHDIEVVGTEHGEDGEELLEHADHVGAHLDLRRHVAALAVGVAEANANRVIWRKENSIQGFLGKSRRRRRGGGISGLRVAYRLDSDIE